MHNPTRIIRRTKGIVSDGKSLTCADIDLPGFDWMVRIRTLAIGLCGGDFEGRIALPRGWTHMVVGHEGLVQAQESVQWNGQTVKAQSLYVPIPGRRLSIENPDKACPLGEEGCGLYVNRGTTRWHGYATRENLEDPRYLIPIPDSLADFGFLVEPAAICQHTLRQALEQKLLHRSPVAIVGLGSLGLMLAAMLIDLGVEVWGCDPVTSGPRKEAFDWLGSIATLMNSQSISHYAGQFGLVIESAGGPRSLVDALQLVEMGGTVLTVGIPMGDGVISGHNTLVTKGAHVTGVVSASRLDFHQAVHTLHRWVFTHREFLNRLVTHRIPYREFDKALTIVPKDRIKVMLTFD